PMHYLGATMDFINDNTVELRKAMVDIGVPDFEVSANYHYTASNPSLKPEGGSWGNHASVNLRYNGFMVFDSERLRQPDVDAISNGVDRAFASVGAGSSIDYDYVLFALSSISTTVESKSLSLYNHQLNNWFYSEKFYGSVESGWYKANPNLLKYANYAKGAGYFFYFTGLYKDLNSYRLGHQDGAKTSLNIGISTWSSVIGGLTGLSYYAGYLYWDKIVVPDIKKNPEFGVQVWDAQMNALP
ncbi:hypothetical protein LX69_03556, partial [Breznakibacter xylanolyticus]